MTIAVIPVKRLEQSKSRLLPELPDARRQALTLAMLEDLIEALSSSGCVERIAVTTPDPTVASRARDAGAVVLLHPEPGLNEALADAARRLAPARHEAFVVVLGDVAGALPGDFRRLIESAHAAGAPARGVWLAPSTDGGTSALLVRPFDVIPFCFGRESATRHREAARAAQVAYHELALASLAIDLDQPEDLATFLATEGGGPRTRALLGRPLDEHEKERSVP